MAYNNYKIKPNSSLNYGYFIPSYKLRDRACIVITDLEVTKAITYHTHSIRLLMSNYITTMISPLVKKIH